MCSMVAVPKTLFLHAHRFCSYFDQETSIHRLGKNFAFLYIFSTPHVMRGSQTVNRTWCFRSSDRTTSNAAYVGKAALNF